MQMLPAPMEVVFDVHEYHLSDAEEQSLRKKLEGLARQVEHFPVAEFRAYVQGVRSNQVVVKLTLILPGTTFSVDDYDEQISPAFDRCLNSLIHELEAYKDRLSRKSDTAKLEEGTHQEVMPSMLVDPEAIEEAVSNGDYPAFRTATQMYDDALRMRVGRWIQREPELDELVDKAFAIADVVEEVFLLAFEGYTERPLNVPFGTWLDQLIDPAIKTILQNPDDAMENIALVRTERDAAEGRTPV